MLSILLEHPGPIARGQPVYGLAVPSVPAGSIRCRESTAARGDVRFLREPVRTTAAHSPSHILSASEIVRGDLRASSLVPDWSKRNECEQRSPSVTGNARTSAAVALAGARSRAAGIGSPGPSSKLPIRRRSRKDRNPTLGLLLQASWRPRKKLRANPDRPRRRLRLRRKGSEPVSTITE